MTTKGPKRGDLEPPLVIDMTAAPTTVDLTLVTSWKIFGRLRGSDALVIDAVPVVVVDPVEKWKAVATHAWTAPETAAAGLLLVELQATWPSGRPQSFPNNDDGPDYIEIRISDDLG